MNRILMLSLAIAFIGCGEKARIKNQKIMMSTEGKYYIVQPKDNAKTAYTLVEVDTSYAKLFKH